MGRALSISRGGRLSALTCALLLWGGAAPAGAAQAQAPDVGTSVGNWVIFTTNCFLPNFPNPNTPDEPAGCNYPGGLFPNTAVGVANGSVITGVTFAYVTYQEPCPPALGTAMGRINFLSGSSVVDSEYFSWTRKGNALVILLSPTPSPSFGSAIGAGAGTWTLNGLPSGDPTCQANGGQGGPILTSITAGAAW